MKNRLEWYVERKNMRGVPVVYRAEFKAKITKSIEFYIAYTISLTANNDWQFVAFYYLPDGVPAVIKNCYTIEIGKKMAEDELQKIFDGMKKLVDN